MSSASGIAQSGLLVAALAVDVSANNVANALTADFTPSRVVPAELAGGGVTADVEPVPDPRTGRDAMDEVRADRALLVPDRVDLVRELVGQARAAAIYQANLATLRTATELEETLVDALGE